MPRSARIESGTGIFHVMMRGINHQNDTLVNEPLSDDIGCMDIEDPSRSRPSDDQVWAYIKEATGVTNSSAFQQLEADVRYDILKKLKCINASHRQLERLTGIGRGIIQKI